MERYVELLNMDLKEDKKIEIAQEVSRPKPKKPLDLSKFDWARAQAAGPRDERTMKGPCAGVHVPERFGRGSQSGVSGHAVWIVCSQCKLRLLYAPTWGAEAVYRSAGPLAADVKKKLGHSPNDIHPSQLETKTLALEAAENSALQRLEGIRKEKEKQKLKGKMDPQPKALNPPPTKSTGSGYPNVAKKEAKREHEIPAEVAEKEGWISVDP